MTGPDTADCATDCDGAIAPGPRGVRAGRAILPLLLMTACCCSRGVTPRRSIDLLPAATCARVDGEARGRRAELRPERSVLERRGDTLDLFVDVPPDGEMLVELGSDSASTVVLSAKTSTGEEPISFEKPAAHSLRADLSRFVGELTRLRIENVSDESVRVTSARVSGHWPVREAPLPRPSTVGDAPLNVLLYVVDALRADHMSVYGYARPTTPRLEAFAQSSIAFDRAYATGSNTVWSVPALMTSMYAATPAGKNGLQLNPRRPKVAELFQRAGYATAGFQANFWLRGSLGFGSGFDTYEVLASGAKGNEKVDAEVLHERILAWLDGETRRPFFVYVQSMDVHNPYRPPGDYLGRFSADMAPIPEQGLAELPAGMLDEPEATQRFYRKTVAALHPRRYDDGIAYADAQLGKLVDALEARGLLDTTMIVVTADHGESLGEGFRFLHGVSLNEEQVRVPLIVRVPGQSAGRRSAALVDLLDVAPTLADAAGLAAPASFMGRSLFLPRPPEAPEVVFGDAQGNQFARMGSWKLMVTAGKPHLCDLSTDPREQVDLAGSRPVVAGYLERLVCTELDRLAEMPVEAIEAVEADPGLSPDESRRVESALRALGYIE